MNKKLRIQDEIDKTLDSFGKAPSIQADPYFLTRLRARIDEESSRHASPGSRFMESLKPALLAGIVAANIVTGVLVLGPSETTRADRLQSFAEAYSLDDATSILYDR